MSHSGYKLTPPEARLMNRACYAASMHSPTTSPVIFAARSIRGITVVCAILGSSSLRAETRASDHDAHPQGAAMATRAKGTFDVAIKPLTADGDAPLGRMSLEKELHGDLNGSSKGQMLTVGTDVAGSAGYVAIERVTGKLHGRTGSFVLQHNGSMTRSSQQLSITVLPDSGTDQLTGLSGKMTIAIVDGQHLYEFEYTLPETP